MEKDSVRESILKVVEKIHCRRHDPFVQKEDGQVS